MTKFGEQLKANEIITVISDLRLKTKTMRVATFADVQWNKFIKPCRATGLGGREYECDTVSVYEAVAKTDAHIQCQ